MRSSKLERLWQELCDAEAALAKAKTAYRTQELAECDHSWRDESFESGHNDNREEMYRCVTCGHVVHQDPRT